jgi:hypothetical protein
VGGVVLIRRYGDGRVRFTGNNAELERRPARTILAERREFEERLHERHMALLGKTNDPARGRRTREVLHLVSGETSAGSSL